MALGVKTLFDIYQDIYDRREASPLWWSNKSSDLHASAAVLWCSMNDDGESIKSALDFPAGFSTGVACWPVYQMFFGMAFELILKAMSVAKNNKAVYSHKLSDLVKNSDVQLSTEEMDILILLTESIIWEGGHPTPKSKEHLESHYKKASEVLYDENPLGKEKLKIKTPNGKLNWDNLNAIYGKFRSSFLSYITPNKAIRFVPAIKTWPPLDYLRVALVSVYGGVIFH